MNTTASPAPLKEYRRDLVERVRNKARNNGGDFDTAVDATVQDIARDPEETTKIWEVFGGKLLRTLNHEEYREGNPDWRPGRNSEPPEDDGRYPKGWGELNRSSATEGNYGSPMDLVIKLDNSGEDKRIGDCVTEDFQRRANYHGKLVSTNRREQRKFEMLAQEADDSRPFEELWCQGEVSEEARKILNAMRKNGGSD